MKFTIPELLKNQYQDTSFEATLDVSMFAEDDPEILNVTPVKLTGRYNVEASEQFQFTLRIETTLTLTCAITLDPIAVPLDIHVTETFCERPNDPDCRKIEGITVDLLPIVWSNIYLEKPLRVTKPDATFDHQEEIDKIDKQTINPAFAALKKYKK